MGLIEVSVVGGRGKLQLTGTLGSVMKESASAALSYARARAGLLGIDRDFHRTFERRAFLQEVLTYDSETLALRKDHGFLVYRAVLETQN